MKYRLGILLLCLTITVVTALAALNQESNDKKKKNDEVVTTIQEGVMTSSQREHSKLYAQRPRGRKKLRDFKQSMDITSTTPWSESPGSVPTSTEEIIQKESCGADAVVVGTIDNKASQLTEDGYYVFTDHVLNVEDVLKDNARSSITVNSKVVVTMPGGAVKLNGNVIRVVDKSFLPLEMGGRYLLFLRFVPSTGAYQWVGKESAFELSQNKVGRRTERQLPFQFIYEYNPDGLINETRSAVARCGQNQAGSVR